MNLWSCPVHGLTGPRLCCDMAGRATILVSPRCAKCGAEGAAGVSPERWMHTCATPASGPDLSRLRAAHRAKGEPRG